jgi:hypothetical protein
MASLMRVKNLFFLSQYKIFSWANNKTRKFKNVCFKIAFILKKKICAQSIYCIITNIHVRVIIEKCSNCTKIYSLVTYLILDCLSE